MGRLKGRVAVLIWCSCGLLSSVCGGHMDVNGMVRSRLEGRRGTPEIFYLNGAPFSARSFRRELYFERRQIGNRFEPPEPRELRQYLRSYIEETILLGAVGELDLNSADARDYLWPFLRRGIIAYYLEKKSGAFDLNRNYANITIPAHLIEKYYRSRKAGFKDERISPAKLKERLSRTAIRMKWRKLHHAGVRRKKTIIGNLKRRNKVRLVAREIYKIPGTSK